LAFFVLSFVLTKSPSPNQRSSELFSPRYLFDDAKFSILADIVKDVDVVPNVAIFFESDSTVTVNCNVQFLMGLPDVDCAVVELERIGSLIPVRTMAAPFVSCRNFND